MNRTFIRYAIVCAVVFCLTISTDAANKPKATAISVDAVQGLLLSEPQTSNESVDRRDVLKPGARPETDPDAVWWQAGYTLLEKQWRAFEESTASGMNAELFDQYDVQRAELSKQPHGQWKLATWCRKNGLPDQERVHLLRVLAERDPTVNFDSVYERLGCQKVGNAWVSPQERKEIARIQSDVEQSHKRWDSKLATLVQQLDGIPKQRAHAEKQLLEITHPSAVPAIVSVFCMSTQTLAEYGVKILGQIPEFQSSRALAGQAVFSPWMQIRKKSIEHLKQRKLPEYVPDLLLLLSNPIQTQTSRSVLTFGLKDSSGRFIEGVNWDYVWVDEGQNTIKIGIRRLFPITFQDISQFQTMTVRRTVNDEALTQMLIYVAVSEMSSQKDLLDHNADKVNDLRIELNEKVGTVLSQCTGEQISCDPKSWWSWWANYSNQTLLTTKDILIVDERQSQPNIPSLTIQRHHSCLVAGTPVWTERGFKAIEQIRPGDRVLAKDVDSGELAYKPVEINTVREPTPVEKFSVGEDIIVASPGHHFWVSGEGWTKTRELIPMHPLHTATGMLRVTSVKDERQVEKVYNLVVADFHTYFVGKSMMLSHDVTTPRLANVKVPGLTPK